MSEYHDFKDGMPENEKMVCIAMDMVDGKGEHVVVHKLDKWHVDHWDSAEVGCSIQNPLAWCYVDEFIKK